MNIDITSTPNYINQWNVAIPAQDCGAKCGVNGDEIRVERFSLREVIYTHDQSNEISETTNV